MPAYIVSTVRVSDPVRFKTYMDGIAGLAEECGGKYVVRGPVKAVLEGDSPADERVVVVEFADEAAVHAYVGHPRYVAAKAHRIGAGTVDLRLLVTP